MNSMNNNWDNDIVVAIPVTEDGEMMYTDNAACMRLDAGVAGWTMGKIGETFESACEMFGINDADAAVYRKFFIDHVIEESYPPHLTATRSDGEKCLYLPDDLCGWYLGWKNHSFDEACNTLGYSKEETENYREFLRLMHLVP